MVSAAKPYGCCITPLRPQLEQSLIDAPDIGRTFLSAHSQSCVLFCLGDADGADSVVDATVSDKRDPPRPARDFTEWARI